MSKKIVRESKFRHIYGHALKHPEIYENVNVTKSSVNSTFCCVNPKFLAIVVEVTGGGSFLVLDLEKTGRVDRNTPLVSGHASFISDLAWCLHNDNLIASGSEDGTIKIWQIPDTGLEANMTEPVADLIGHKRRVVLLNWHPTVNLVLLSAGLDNQIFIWNVNTGLILTEIQQPDLIYSAVWNYEGSALAVSCKDKFIRVYNPRNGKESREAFKAHEGSKSVKLVFMRNGNLLSTGFSRTAGREIALWNVLEEAAAASCSSSLESVFREQVDNGNSSLFAFYDPDLNLVYLCGKGDSSIRFFEYTPAEAPFLHALGSFTLSEPQRGIGHMPKRGLNIAHMEIARFYRLNSRDVCEVVAIVAPRKSDLFQEDIYTTTASAQPAIEDAAEWMRGRDAPPLRMQLSKLFDECRQRSASAAGGASLLKTSSGRALCSAASNFSSKSTLGQNGAAGSQTSLVSQDFDDSSLKFKKNSVAQRECQEEIARLKQVVESLEKRVDSLEQGKISSFE